MVHRASPSSFAGTKAYVTSADPRAQAAYRIGFEDIDAELKLWLLLNDHVVLAFSHVLYSDVTYRWVRRNAEAISGHSNPGLLPGLRDDCSGFREYLELDRSRHDQPTRLDARYTDYLARVDCAEETFPNIISFPVMSETTWFRDAVCGALTDSGSPLRRRMVGVPRVAIDSLVGELQAREYLSRETLDNLSREHCPTRSGLLGRFGDFCYYLSGAVFNEAAPVLPAQAAELGCASVTRSVVRSAAHPEASMGRDLWQNVCDSWRVARTSLNQMTMNDVLSIRDGSVGKRLRATWRRVLAATDLEQPERRASELRDRQHALMEFFTKEVESQFRRHRLVEHGRKAIDVVAWTLGGAVGLYGIATERAPLAVPAVTLALLAGVPIAAAARRVPGTELAVISTQLRR